MDKKLIKNRPSKEDEVNILKDDELAWKYFDELQFDMILANPPFAGEMKDKKMLSQYELAKPALKRAKDKGAKEERDVLFIERILKFLKPGGRAAIVLPQGKFNNSSLAFIREWLLRKARLLAVVGLHPNSFKPHTGTKTSVLFLQKYTQTELKNIEDVKQKVAKDCPDYEKQIEELLSNFKGQLDIPEKDIPEKINALLIETFSDGEETTVESEHEEESLGPEEVITAAEDKISSLNSALSSKKAELEKFSSDIETLTLTANQKMDVISSDWTDTKKSLNVELKPIKEQLKLDIKSLKTNQKDQIKHIKAEIKLLGNAILNALFDLKKLSNTGKLELLLADHDLIGSLKERWIDAEVAEKLDYPIFMAVSERGGKNNSGDYEYLCDKNGNFIEFDDGQLIIDQDLVNFDLKAEDLNDATFLLTEQICIAEAFIQFAQSGQTE